jgi:hypothetical protein
VLGAAPAAVVVVLLEILPWIPFKFAAPAAILIPGFVCATFVAGLVDGLIATGPLAASV